MRSTVRLFVIARPVEIGNKARLRGVPSQLFPGLCARGTVVDRGKVGEPAEMVGCLLPRLADDGQVQAAADDLGYLAEGNALFSDPVVARACGAFFEHQPVETGGVEPVDGRPEVQPLADVGRDALLAGKADEDGNEAMIAVAMDRWRQAHRRCADTPRYQQGRRLF